MVHLHRPNQAHTATFSTLARAPWRLSGHFFSLLAIFSTQVQPRALWCSSQICDARVQALQRAHHTARLRQVKPQVDAGAPRRSMGTNLKGARIEEERNAQIARENTILLGEKRPYWAEIGQWQSQRPLIRCTYSAGLIQTHTSRSNRRQTEQDFRT